MQAQEQPQSSQPTQGAPAAGSKSDDNLVAALSYVGIISIVVLLIKKDNDYVQFHAKQGTVLFGIEVVWMVITFILWFLLLISWLVWIVFLVASIIGFIQALSGKRYQMPLIYDLSKRINI